MFGKDLIKIKIMKKIKKLIGLKEKKLGTMNQ